MKLRHLGIASLLSSLISCGSGNSDSSPPHQFQGIWTSQAYGESYNIGKDSVDVYQYTSQYCLFIERLENISINDLNEYFMVNEDENSLEAVGNTGTSNYFAPAISYYKQESLPEKCSSPIVIKGQPGYTPNAIRDFDIFWHTFNEYYFTFELKQVDWQNLYHEVRNQLSEDSTEEELFGAIDLIVEPLSDPHVQVISDQQGRIAYSNKANLLERLIWEYFEAHQIEPPITPEQEQAVAEYLESNLEKLSSIITSYAEDETQIKTAANQQMLWFRNSNIGYLQINSMDGFSLDPEDSDSELAALETAIDQAIDDLQDTNGLIIDVRHNYGGHDFISMAIASRFVDSEKVVARKQARLGAGRTDLVDFRISPRGPTQYLKPVVVLTSHSTVSAAEIFTLMMSALPNVTLVGEPTQGALSDQLEKNLPGGIRFSLSNEFYLSIDGEWFEATGIPVNNEVDFFTPEQREQASDLGIETAFQLLTNEGKINRLK